MESFDTSLGLYAKIDCGAGISEKAAFSEGTAEISIINEADFELPLPYSSAENSWHSNSSEDYSIDGFNQLDHQPSVNSSDVVVVIKNNNIKELSNPLYTAVQSAFRKYATGDPIALLDSARSCQILHKRCLRFLRKIGEERKFGSQSSSLAAPGNNNIQEKYIIAGFRKKSAFQHMIAERNRRVKLKQHFQDLYKHLPGNSKRDKHSILANTTRYLGELKLRLAELEQRNQTLEESNPEGSARFESQERPSFISEAATLLYSCDEVTLEQSKDIPTQVNMRINVQLTQVSCPSSLLINLLERLRAEQLEILSIQSQKEAFQFHANILIGQKGWDNLKWKFFGDLVRQCLL